jgi:hypothetical protein
MFTVFIGNFYCTIVKNLIGTLLFLLIPRIRLCDLKKLGGLMFSTGNGKFCLIMSATVASRSNIVSWCAQEQKQ